ncbi:MAG: sigma-54 dependent transcriptional regulator [Candidatus Thiodiazotropha sp.]
MADALLIIENDKSLGEQLTAFFEQQGWEVNLVSDLEQARHRLIEQNDDPMVILADMTLPDGDSLDLLEQVRQQGLVSEWVLLTGEGGVPESVRALRLGAYDLLEKPCDMERLSSIVRGARRSARAQRQLRDQRHAGSRRYLPDAFIGRSKAAIDVRRLLSRIVEVPFSALVITGGTGTGKGLVARILHHSGPASDGPLIEVNCAALPRDLLESELFGHEAGAFTGAKGRHRGYFEQADGGTLFLDEIGEMDLNLQAKLLTAIESKTVRRLGGEQPVRVDVQVIAASNRDLEEQVRTNEFRSDLYHRLSVFRLDLPPLRDRLEDLEDLVPPIVAEFNAVAGRQVKVIPDSVYHKMRGYDWPGNVRELRNVVERAVLLANGELFPESWLQLDNCLSQPQDKPVIEGNHLILPLDGSMALDEMDSYIIQAALDRCGYNVTATARALGTTRETLRYRIQKYNLSTEPVMKPEQNTLREMRAARA